jgi:hypothetical protein
MLAGNVPIDSLLLRGGPPKAALRTSSVLLNLVA